MFHGIVISTSQYKDNDAIINILTSEKIVPIIVRGALNPKSINKELTNPFIMGDFETYVGPTKYYKLRGATNIVNPYLTQDETLDSLSILEVLKELAAKFPPIDNYDKMYKLFEITILNLKESGYNYKNLILFVGYYIKLLGYKPNLDNCTLCGKKINSYIFSFKEGGLLCTECEDPNSILLKEDEFKVIYSIFNEKYKDFEKQEFGNELYKKITIFLLTYLEFISDTKIISKNLL